MTIQYKLTASGNFIHSILNHKLMRLVQRFTATKNLKKAGKIANSKKLSEKCRAKSH